MTGSISKTALAVLGALALAGCADGSTGLLSTSSLGTAPTASAAAAAKADPACVALTARIDALRKEGVVERVEKASAGKTKTVSVKRESLAKVAELDKANQEFQARCALPLNAAAPPSGAAPAAGAATAAKPTTAAAAATPAKSQ